MLAYADSTFANLRDGGTQLGYIIVLADITRRCSILAFRSYKTKRVVLSSGAREAIALADAFDASIVIRRYLENMLKCSVPLMLMTD